MREMLILKKRIARQIPSWSISPLLYLIAFGYAAGHAAPIKEHTYMEFLIPGLIAMSSMSRAVLSVLVIMILGLLFRVGIGYNVVFLAAVLLNSFVFASLAVGLAMVVKSHADQAMLNSFVITPMAFLGGTFFPVDRLPAWAGNILSFLPLTHASCVIRSACLGDKTNPESWLVLSVIGIVFFGMAVFCVEKAKD